jgi:hypothetical protein
MNLFALQPTLEPPQLNASSKYQLDLDIPTEIVLKKGDVVQQPLYAYTKDEFTLALKVFANYNALAEAHLILLKQINLSDEKVNIVYDGFVKCIAVVEKVDADRQFIYKLREGDLAARDKELRKQKIKTVLFTVGGGVVGIGAGILIGFLVGR